MSKIQFAVYVVVLAMAYCEEEQIPILPLLVIGWCRFWYAVAEFAGRQGLAAENKYWKMVKVNG